MSSPIFYLMGMCGPLQNRGDSLFPAEKLLCPSPAGCSSVQWSLGLPSFWEAPTLTHAFEDGFIRRSTVQFQCRQMLLGCIPGGQAAENTSLQHMGIVPAILPPWLPPQKPEFTKEDAHVSLRYWNGDLFPLFFSVLPQQFAVCRHPHLSSFSRAFQSAVSRTSGQCTHKLDATGLCGWAVQPRDQLRLTSPI